MGVGDRQVISCRKLIAHVLSSPSVSQPSQQHGLDISQEKSPVLSRVIQLGRHAKGTARSGGPAEIAIDRRNPTRCSPLKNRSNNNKQINSSIYYTMRSGTHALEFLFAHLENAPKSLQQRPSLPLLRRLHSTAGGRLCCCCCRRCVQASAQVLVPLTVSPTDRSTAAAGCCSCR